MTPKARDLYRRRVRNAARRVLPLRTPNGTVLGYMVRRARPGQLALGPYANQSEAMSVALADTEEWGQWTR